MGCGTGRSSKYSVDTVDRDPERRLHTKMYSGLLIFLPFSPLFHNVANSTCLEQRGLVHSTQYSGKKISQGLKLSKIVPNELVCVSFCVYTGDKTSIIYDPGTGTCYCSNLPLSMLTTSPLPGAAAFGVEDLTSDMVVAWIDSVLGESSHFWALVRSYPATRMIGPPDFYPSYDNTDRAWCPATRNADQWVELAISESIYITEVHIYEVFYAGGVETLSILDPDSNWMEVWRTPGLQILEYSRIFSPNFVPPDFKSNAIRIDLDLGSTNVWSEFDAVRVVGTRTRTRHTLQ